MQPEQSPFVSRAGRLLGITAMVGALVLLGLVFRLVQPQKGQPHPQALLATPTSIPTEECDAKSGIPCPTNPLGFTPSPKVGFNFSPIPVESKSPSYLSPPGSITPNAPPPPAGSDYVIENYWWDTAGDTAYAAWAGALGSDPSQGIVIEETGPVDDPAQTATFHEYETPTKDGSVTISQASGTTVPPLRLMR